MRGTWAPCAQVQHIPGTAFSLLRHPHPPGAGGTFACVLLTARNHQHRLGEPSGRVLGESHGAAGASQVGTEGHSHLTAVPRGGSILSRAPGLSMLGQVQSFHPAMRVLFKKARRFSHDPQRSGLFLNTARNSPSVCLLCFLTALGRTGGGDGRGFQAIKAAWPQWVSVGAECQTVGCCSLLSLACPFYLLPSLRTSSPRAVPSSRAGPSAGFAPGEPPKSLLQRL